MLSSTAQNWLKWNNYASLKRINPISPHYPLSISFLFSPDFVEKTMRLQGAQPIETLELVKKMLVDERPANFEECIAWARLLFQELYHNHIRQLLHNFPPDQTTR